ncbi:MAG: hypothetical protein WD470_00310 [Rhodospirillaceae bacterium]
MMKAQKRRQAEAAANGGEAPEQQASMPRLGTPGSITRDQIRLLKENNFEPSRLWSREEAQLILDSVTYLRAAIYTITQETDPPLEVQNKLLRFILATDELRSDVYDWSVNRTRDDSGKALPDLPRDELFAKVEAEILRQWEAN